MICLLSLREGTLPSGSKPLRMNPSQADREALQFRVRYPNEALSHKNCSWSQVLLRSLAWGALNRTVVCSDPWQIKKDGLRTENDNITPRCLCFWLPQNWTPLPPDRGGPLPFSFDSWFLLLSSVSEAVPVHSLGEVKFSLSRFPLQLIWSSQFSSLQESTRNTWPLHSPQGTPPRICSLIIAWVEGIWIQRPRTAVLWRSCLLWVWGLTNLSLKGSDRKNFSLSDPDKEFIKGIFVLWLANKVLHIYIYVCIVCVCVYKHTDPDIQI